ncbi:alpha-galactosidase [Dubosiella newyorkensis]|uniref:alpha-galactosidase n=1 Tax=Dubosiella newyorkensis TaxID=1862672 RepID=UPI003F66F773
MISGMLYYARKLDERRTDAAERNQDPIWETSVLLSLCSMGSHVSAITNHQLNRTQHTGRGLRSRIGNVGLWNRSI